MSIEAPPTMVSATARPALLGHCSATARARPAVVACAGSLPGNSVGAIVVRRYAVPTASTAHRVKGDRSIQRHVLIKQNVTRSIIAGTTRGVHSKNTAMIAGGGGGGGGQSWSCSQLTVAGGGGGQSWSHSQLIVGGGGGGQSWS